MASGDSRWLRGIDALKTAVGESRLLVPLSAAHYLELWHRCGQRSREEVGGLMRDLSGCRTLAPVQVVRSLEVDAFVERYLGGGRRIGSDDVLGSGVVHAFASEHGRFRFVESIETAESPEGPAANAPEVLEALRARPDLWEWVHLVGTQDFIGADGVDRTPEHRYGDRFVEQELYLRRRIDADAKLRARLHDVIIAEAIEVLVDEINRSSQLRGIDPHALFLAHPGVDPLKQCGRSWPASRAWTCVPPCAGWWKHKDLGLRWEQRQDGPDGVGGRDALL